MEAVPCQVLLEESGFQLSTSDLSELEGKEQNNQLKILAQREAAMPFDLTLGPLWRCRLIKLGIDRNVLIVTMHHIIADGWSINIALKEIGILYGAYMQGKPSPLEPLKLQYADFAAWQRKRMENGALDKQRAFWRKTLDGSPPYLKMPYDFHRPPVQTSAGALYEIEVNQDILQTLKTITEQKKTTLYMIFLAAYALVLARYSGARDISIGTPVANRTHQQLEPLIGLFINTIVLRLMVNESATLEELLEHIKKTTLDAFNNQEIPFDKIVEDFNGERNPAFTPLFQVLFAFNETVLPDVSIEGLSLKPLSIHSGASQFDLSLYMTTMSGSAICHFEYNTQLFSPQTIETLAKDFMVVVKHIAKNEEAKLNDFFALIPAKRLQIAVGSSFTIQPVEESLTFVLQELSLPNAIRFAPYGQVFQQLLEPESLFSTNSEGINLLYIRLMDWAQNESLEAACKKVTDNSNQFVDALEYYQTACAIPLQIVLCPSAQDTGAPLAKAIAASEATIFERCAPMPTITIADAKQWIEQYRLKEVFDVLGDKEGHIPYTKACFTLMGTESAKALLENAA